VRTVQRRASGEHRIPVKDAGAVKLARREVEDQIPKLGASKMKKFIVSALVALVASSASIAIDR
jgi:hypothetical protein